MRLRTIAGWGVVMAAAGLAAVSGNLAYHGFESMLSIPFAGWIGPFVAASLIGLGIGVESELRDREWKPAAALAILLVSAAALDQHSGELALKAQVEAAAQANADRTSGYETAVAQKTAAEGILAGLAKELELLDGSDTIAIQKHVGTTPDGQWGSETAKRVANRKDQISAEREAASADVRKWADVVAAGAPVATLPFSMEDARIYALLITALSVILAFAGSWIAHPREDLAKLETEVETLENNLIVLERFLDAA